MIVRQTASRSCSGDQPQVRAWHATRRRRRRFAAELARACGRRARPAASRLGRARRLHVVRPPPGRHLAADRSTVARQRAPAAIEDRAVRAPGDQAPADLLALTEGQPRLRTVGASAVGTPPASSGPRAITMLLALDPTGAPPRRSATALAARIASLPRTSARSVRPGTRERTMARQSRSLRRHRRLDLASAIPTGAPCQIAALATESRTAGLPDFPESRGPAGSPRSSSRAVVTSERTASTWS